MNVTTCLNRHESPNSQKSAEHSFTDDKLCLSTVNCSLLFTVENRKL